MDCICLAIMRSLSSQENQIINQQTDDTIHLNVKKNWNWPLPYLIISTTSSKARRVNFTLFLHIIKYQPISILYCITIQIHVNTNQPLPLPGRGTPPASVTLGTRSVGTTWSSYTAASLSGPSSPTHPHSSYSSHLQRKQENMCDCRQICVDETVLNRMKRNCIYEKNLQQSRTYFQSFEMLFE